MDKEKSAPGIVLQNSYLLLLPFAGLLLLYYPVLLSLSKDWASNDNYSHGYFIPLISGYMIYTMQDELRRTIVQPVNWGILILLAGFCQLIVAKAGSEYFLQRTSLILVLLGACLFILGRDSTKKLLLPICYLIFMVPIPAIIWNKIAFPLQLFASEITEQVIQLLGIPVFREGNVLHLSETTLEVVDACSGLRSLTTMFALSAALAWFSKLSTWKKWVLFIAAAPIAVFTNIIRLTATAILASRFGEKVAQGFLHEFSGIVTFILGLALLLGVYSLLGRIKKQ